MLYILKKIIFYTAVKVVLLHDIAWWINPPCPYTVLSWMYIVVQHKYRCLCAPGAFSFHQTNRFTYQVKELLAGYPVVTTFRSKCQLLKSVCLYWIRLIECCSGLFWFCSRGNIWSCTFSKDPHSAVFRLFAAWKGPRILARVFHTSTVRSCRVTLKIVYITKLVKEKCAFKGTTARNCSPLFFFIFIPTDYCLKWQSDVVLVFLPCCFLPLWGQFWGI